MEGVTNLQEQRYKTVFSVTVSLSLCDASKFLRKKGFSTFCIATFVHNSRGFPAGQYPLSAAMLVHNLHPCIFTPSIVSVTGLTKYKKKCLFDCELT
jgi:hypothetical protein